MKKIIYALIVILVLVGFYLIFSPTAPAFSYEEKTIAETNDYYYTDISYPETNIPFLNEEISAYIEKTISDFKKIIQDNIIDLPEEIRSSATGSLIMKYSIISENGIVSILFENGEYSGGAHGNVFFKTFNYNPSSKKLLTLADLFKKDSDYIQRISELSRIKLSEKMNEYLDEFLVSMIEGGTEPKSENFENFGITREGIMIYFPPYQVAPYALGTHEVSISFEEVSDILSIDITLLIPGE